MSILCKFSLSTKHSVWIDLPSHRKKITNWEIIKWIKSVTMWPIFVFKVAPHLWLAIVLNTNKPGRYNVKYQTAVSFKRRGVSKTIGKDCSAGEEKDLILYLPWHQATLCVHFCFFVLLGNCLTLQPLSFLVAFFKVVFRAQNDH